MTITKEQKLTLERLHSLARQYVHYLEVVDSAVCGVLKREVNDSIAGDLTWNPSLTTVDEVLTALDVKVTE